MNINCKDCMFYHKYQKKNNGQCRMKTPTLHVIQDKSQETGYSKISSWPETGDSQYCGQGCKIQRGRYHQ